MRATKRQESRRRVALSAGLFAIGLVVGVALGALLVPLPAEQTEPGLADAIVELRLQVHYLNASLELFLLEYGDSLQDPSELAGAQGHLARADRIFSKIKADLSLLDANGTMQVSQDLVALRRGMDNRSAVA